MLLVSQRDGETKRQTEEEIKTEGKDIKGEAKSNVKEEEETKTMTRKTLRHR